MSIYSSQQEIASDVIICHIRHVCETVYCRQGCKICRASLARNSKSTDMVIWDAVIATTSDRKQLLTSHPTWQPRIYCLDVQVKCGDFRLNRLSSGSVRSNDGHRITRHITLSRSDIAFHSFTRHRTINHRHDIDDSVTCQFPRNIEDVRYVRNNVWNR